MILLSRPSERLDYEFLIDSAKFLLGYALNVESSSQACPLTSHLFALYAYGDEIPRRVH